MAAPRFMDLGWAPVPRGRDAVVLAPFMALDGVQFVVDEYELTDGRAAHGMTVLEFRTGRYVHPDGNEPAIVVYRAAGPRDHGARLAHLTESPEAWWPRDRRVAPAFWTTPEGKDRPGTMHRMVRELALRTGLFRRTRTWTSGGAGRERVGTLWRWAVCPHERLRVQCSTCMAEFREAVAAAVALGHMDAAAVPPSFLDELAGRVNRERDA